MVNESKKRKTILRVLEIVIFILILLAVFFFTSSKSATGNFSLDIQPLFSQNTVSFSPQSCDSGNGITGEVSAGGLCSVQCKRYAFNPHKDCRIGPGSDYGPTREYCYKINNDVNLCVECIVNQNCGAGGTCNSNKECEYEESATCGNGVKEGSEQCDDGNLVDGDGCTSTCRNEGGNQCPPGCLQCNSQGQCTYADPDDCYPACQDGEVCNKEARPPQCIPKQCTQEHSSVECSGELICLGGLCKVCETNSDCGVGLYCKNKGTPDAQCRPVINLNECKSGDKKCVSDTEFQKCHATLLGYKWSKDKPCGTDEVCEEKTKNNAKCIPKQTTKPASCSDGIKNQGEEDIDCGGPCKETKCEGQSDRCVEELNGYCQPVSSYCPGEYRVGQCPGSSNWRCCVTNDKETICGNGVPQGDEQCDDGNNVDGDGCSSQCIREDGGECTLADRVGNKCAKYIDPVTRYASQFNLDPLFIFAIMKKESGCNPGLVYNEKDGTSSYGLMQINSKHCGESLAGGIPENPSACKSLLLGNPDYNINVGAELLAGCVNRCNSIKGAATCYNSGSLCSISNPDYTYEDDVNKFYNEMRNKC